MNRASTDNAALMSAGLNLIQQALTIYDSDLRLALCNRRFQEMFDLPQALVTPGATFDDTIRHMATRGEYGPTDDVEAAVAHRVQLARAFEPHYMERLRANGRWISVEGAPLPQGGWVTVYTDITQTKRQEALLRARSAELSDQVIANSEELATTNRRLAAANAALEETKRQLTEIEARTRLTTEMMPAHIAHLNTERRYTHSNRRLGSVLPARPPDILGRHIAEVLGAQTYGRIEPYLNRAFAGEPSVFEFTDDLSSHRIRVAFTPDRQNESDPITGVYILSMDVTEESQARAALQQTRRREMAAQLTSGLAHDFANLLTIILGMQSRLQRMDALPPEAGELVSATLAAAHRGGALLDRIGGVTSPRKEHPEPVDLAAFLADFQVLATSSLPDKISFAIKGTPGADPVLVDIGMLQDSLLNLVLNARDACQAAPGASGRITLSVRVIGNTWIEFSVTDTGRGFSDEALKHAFDPFYTTKGDEGSGLGLSMVYDMTKLAGGEVQVANGYSGGRVTLRLPWRRAHQTHPPGLVLLVEDSADLRVSVREMLRDMGHSVVEAASVDEALALFEGLPDITLVLSDIQLEGEATGHDLAHALRPKGVPVYLMSSLPGAGAQVLAKPFTADQLSAFLRIKAAAE